MVTFPNHLGGGSLVCQAARPRYRGWHRRRLRHLLQRLRTAARAPTRYTSETVPPDFEYSKDGFVSKVFWKQPLQTSLDYNLPAVLVVGVLLGMTKSRITPIWRVHGGRIYMRSCLSPSSLQVESNASLVWVLVAC
jgi:hypothetical protein